MNHDVEILEVTGVVKHPNADKLDIISLGGYQVVYSTARLKLGDKVVYIASDAQIDLTMPWTECIQGYLGKYGRVKTIQLRKEYSEGIILTIPQVEAFNLFDKPIETLTAEELATGLNIKHFELPLSIRGVAILRPSLPFGLPKTDQENVQHIRRDTILGKRYLVTRKKDGSSCTIALYNSPELGYIDIHVTSRSVDLNLAGENAFTQATDPVIRSVMQRIVSNGLELHVGQTLILRGEVCSYGIQGMSINKDCTGIPTFYLYEAFIMDDPTTVGYLNRTYLPISLDSSEQFEVVNRVPSLGIIESLTEDQIQDYLLKPASDGEGVVLWEVNWIDDKTVIPTGFSFKIRSKDYDSKIH